MEKYIIIVAGGSGRRMHSEIPKQFLPINGKPILMRTLERFYDFSTAIHMILVLPEEYISYWQHICTEYNFEVPHVLVFGGKERFFSVQNALTHIPDTCLVGIHDGVRPFVKNKTIRSVFDTAETQKTAIPVITPSESIRQRIGDNQSKNINRNDICLVQTPQCFQSHLIKQAYQTNFRIDFTDDASVIESTTDTKITLVEGNEENIKITTPFDIVLAEAIFSSFEK